MTLQKMNLADPELELIDPTPNVHTLFIHFDKLFFWTKLASRAVVRWSKRMYSCAGICSYDRGGLCDIALSEPLLKLRPRKDLIETLLHEMIHAYLFITNRDRERDGHGPNFQAHMHRINKLAGLNISIYHDFHEEVKLYQTYWWRCNGSCQIRKPYFGIVRRSQNRAPGPSDYWWLAHQKTCGGTFVKIKEPEKKTKKSAKAKTSSQNGNITKFINNTSMNVPSDVRKPLTPLEKNISTVPGTKVKSNGANTVVGSKTNFVTSPINDIIKPPLPVFTGTGKPVSENKVTGNTVDVTQTVRNIWAKKQLPGLANSNKLTTGKEVTKNNEDLNKRVKPSKHKAVSVLSDSPPSKIKKIDDYFKNTALNVLKDVYGQDFQLTQCDDNRLAVTNNNMDTNTKTDTVDCPVCCNKVDCNDINRHLDECLNKDVIEKLSKDNKEFIDSSQSKKPDPKSETVPSSKKNGVVKPVIKKSTADLTNNNMIKNEASNNYSKTDNFEPKTNKAVVKKITNDKHKSKSDNYEEPKKEPNVIDYGILPSFLGVTGTAAEVAKVKTEPGTSEGIVSSDFKCPCCGIEINTTVAQHLGECLAFFDNNTTIPEEDNFEPKTNKAVVKKITNDKHKSKSDNYEEPKKEPNVIDYGILPSFLGVTGTAAEVAKVKTEPGTSKGIVSSDFKCPCCGIEINTTVAQHLDECLAFFDNNTTIPDEGASTSFANDTIVIDDDEDDIFDETMTMNATGTKTPCPCCMEMIEISDMNDHLDSCLS